MTKKEWKCRPLLYGVLFVMLVSLAGFSGRMDVSAADVSLEKGDRIEYMGYSTHYYYVNGHLAYCLEPDQKVPDNGEYTSTEISPEKLLAKAMYYVYGGPGYQEYLKPLLSDEWDSAKLEYCLSHCILSFIYDGCDSDSDAFIGLDAALKKEVIRCADAIRQWPSVPQQELSLSETDLEAYFSREEGVQRTESVQCKGDKRNSFTLELPEGVTLVNESEQTRENGKVTVHGTDIFHLEADVAYGNDSVWDSGRIEASISQAWRTLVIQTGADTQHVGSGFLIKVEPSTVSFRVKWLPGPELEVDKEADRAEKRYQVGDLITYTVDITQRIQKAVAKNLIITDRILTEGVRLQKNSIVLLDAERSRVPDAVIEVKGNSFSIAAGEFLSCVEEGERYLVEYQVVITDEDLIGREVENEVIVRADNAEESGDEEIIEVEEPEPEPEPEPESEPEPEPELEPEPEIVIAEEPEVVELKSEPEPVKTGDDTEWTLLAVLLILSCATIFTCVKIASKTKR